MRKIDFATETVKQLDHDRNKHPHPEVRRRALVVWAWSQNFSQRECAQLGGVSERSVRRYLDGFEMNGFEWLREIRWKGPRRRLEGHVRTLEEEFEKNPPRTVTEASDRIRKLCGVQIRPTATREFLHSLDFKWRKIAAIPVPPKITIEEHIATQKAFLDEKLEPVLHEARKGRGHVFFVDAAHFVLGMFLCSLWSKCRLFIRSSSGRQRFNVLGAWNAVTHQFVSVCNTTVVNQDTFCELLGKIALLALVGPITLVLDNAKYQYCKKCIACAEGLGITLLFLPSYSPNLNLIERVWKFIKSDCLYGRHFPSFSDFKSRIEGCINAFDSTHKSKLNSLMTHNFQTFENRSILAA